MTTALQQYVISQQGADDAAQAFIASDPNAAADEQALSYLAVSPQPNNGSVLSRFNQNDPIQLAEFLRGFEDPSAAVLGSINDKYPFQAYQDLESSGGKAGAAPAGNEDAFGRLLNGYTNPTTPEELAYNNFVNTDNSYITQADSMAPDKVGLFGQIFDDVAMAVLAAGTAGAFAAEGAFPALAGAEAGATFGGPTGAVTGAVGGELAGAGLGTAGNALAGAGEGALTSTIKGQNALTGALTGGATGALSSNTISGTSGTNVSTSGGSTSAAGGLAGPSDLTVDLTDSPDLTYAGSSSASPNPGADASAAANFLNPSASTPVADLGGTGNSTGGTGQTNSSVASAIGKVAGPAAGAALPSILDALGVNGAGSTSAGPSLTGSTGISTATASTPTTTAISLAPSAAGSPLGAPTLLENSAADEYKSPTYGGGQKGYGGGSMLSQILSEMGMSR